MIYDGPRLWCGVGWGSVDPGIPISAGLDLMPSTQGGRMPPKNNNQHQPKRKRATFKIGIPGCRQPCVFHWHPSANKQKKLKRGRCIIRCWGPHGKPLTPSAEYLCGQIRALTNGLEPALIQTFMSIAAHPHRAVLVLSRLSSSRKMRSFPSPFTNHGHRRRDTCAMSSIALNARRNVRVLLLAAVLLFFIVSLALNCDRVIRATAGVIGHISHAENATLSRDVRDAYVDSIVDGFMTSLSRLECPQTDLARYEYLKDYRKEIGP
jgi:hypothetical protein